jgi:hypothetical protein
MALVILPPDHRHTDLSLASRIALHFELAELHVFLSIDPAEAAAAEPRDEPSGEGAFGWLVAAVDELIDLVADLLPPWGTRQPKTGKLRRRASRSTPACSDATTSRSLRST